MQHSAYASWVMISLQSYCQFQPQVKAKTWFKASQQHNLFKKCFCLNLVIYWRTYGYVTIDGFLGSIYWIKAKNCKNLNSTWCVNRNSMSLRWYWKLPTSVMEPILRAKNSLKSDVGKNLREKMGIVKMIRGCE